jgi:hypothetical protein
MSQHAGAWFSSSGSVRSRRAAAFTASLTTTFMNHGPKQPILSKARRKVPCGKNPWRTVSVPSALAILSIPLT